jgi:hypothetical protein
MAQEEFFLVRSLMSEAPETGGDREIGTRVGATRDDVRALRR